jgi:hypothetical protein
MFEATFQSNKSYADPFNAVDVDVIFTKDGKSWRVPTFWRGGSRWTVRFAPPTPGTYTYRLESTDRGNADLNGHAARVNITSYTGSSEVLRRGAFQVSHNGRYFEQADGTPFYWLGEDWYAGTSDRINWAGFKTLTADRKAKGFTVIEITVMTCSNEETAPMDPGFRNEGGALWDPAFQRINPQYFDYADRRIQHLIDSGLAPAIIGAWRQALAQMGVAKIKELWRYIIARYGAYPVFWIAGGEIYDPPADRRKAGLPYGSTFDDLRSPGWTEVVRYIRATDPYHHPLTAFEIDPPFDTPLQDESLKDFELFQGGHRGWPSVATEVAQLNMHYARTTVTKPLVIGEIGWETLSVENFEGYQRMAFWLAMVNGAAGYSYGNIMTSEFYSSDKPFHRYKYSARTWEEGMSLPGSYQDGLGAKLLQDYHWQNLVPHPDWITPHGTTLLEPRSAVSGFDIDLVAALVAPNPPPDADLPLGEWKNHHGNFRLPYATGIPGQLRIIYIPPGTFTEPPSAPTVLNLEPNVRYHAYYWDPSLGIKFDLGAVERPAAGPMLHNDRDVSQNSSWMNVDAGGAIERTQQRASAAASVINGLKEANVVAAVDANSNTEAALILRYLDADHYIVARYAPQEKALYLQERIGGVEGVHLGITEIPQTGPHIRLTAEARDNTAVVSLTDGQQTWTSPIVDVTTLEPGTVGVMHRADGENQRFENFEIRRSPVLVNDSHLERKLYDARGVYRGELSGPGWDDFGRAKHILLDAYRPEQPPFPQDFVLVLESPEPGSHSQ